MGDPLGNTILVGGHCLGKEGPHEPTHAGEPLCRRGPGNPAEHQPEHMGQSSKKGHKGGQRIRRELGLFNLERRWLRGDLTDVFKFLTWACKEDGARLCSVVLSRKTQAEMQEILIKHKAHFCCEDGLTLGQIVRNRCEVSICADIHNVTGHGPEQLGVADP